jgi:hypothetical protein
LYYFGYAKLKEDPKNFTGFYPFEETDQNMYKSYNGFRELNRHSIEWNASMTDEERAEI